MADPKITKIEVVVYEHEIQDMGTDYNGFNTVYEKGSVLKMRPSILRIHTTPGSSANRMAGQLSGSVVGYLLGKNPLPSRENLQRPETRAAPHRPHRYQFG